MNIIKKVFIHIRNSVKIISLVTLASFLIIGLIAFIYKPTYSVSLNGEFIGYTKNKSDLQEQINDYIENGDGENIAFVQVDNLPEYKLCLLKKDIQENDSEIFDIVKNSGTPYYKYYAILDEGEEKLYVATYEEAEQAINELKEQNSANKEDLSILEKYEAEPKDIVTKEVVISKLYEKVETKKTTSTVRYASSYNSTSKKVALGINLIRPVSGVITSRFGSRWGTTHKGLDIGAPTGTRNKSSSFWNSSYSTI